MPLRLPDTFLFLYLPQDSHMFLLPLFLQEALRELNADLLFYEKVESFQQLFVY